MVYFLLGFLACIGVIAIEATTHQLSLEIGGDFKPWIIYLSLAVFAFTLAGLAFLCYLGYYYLKKNIKKSLKPKDS